MNKTGILFLVLLVLAGITAWLLFGRDAAQPTSTVAGADRAFSVPEAEIGKVFLADRSGRQTTLNRTADDKWLVDGKYPAREDAIRNLLEAVTKLDVSYKPANAAIPMIISSLATEGIQVTIFDRGGAPLKTYTVGGSTDERGAFVLLDGFEQPYVAHIPGWTGNPRFRYNMHGDQWRDRRLFDLAVDEVAEFSIAYPKQRSASFRVVASESGEWQVLPYYENQTAQPGKARPGRAEAFLVPFEKVGALRYMNSVTDEKKALSDLLPFAELTLRRTDGTTQELELYPRYGQGKTLPTDGRYLDYDRDGYYGLTGQGDLLLVQSSTIEPLLWSYAAFY